MVRLFFYMLVSIVFTLVVFRPSEAKPNFGTPYDGKGIYSPTHSRSFELPKNFQGLASLRPKPNYPPLDVAYLVAAKNQAKSLPMQWDRAWGLASVQFLALAKNPKQVLANCTRGPIVAIIDTGIDYNHPQLQQSLWRNEGELGPWTAPKGASTTLKQCHNKSCNQIDDDGNGFVDDVIGWDFVDNQPLPYDTHGHGTHIAGIVSGAVNPNRGTSGICPGVPIMALKYYDASGVGYNNLINTVRAIQYATKMGARIINYSGGGSDPAVVERMVIEEAQGKGILFITAAGNEGSNNVKVGYYPANYNLPNIISVASLNPLHQLLPSSNYGPSVHIAAPGLSILSTLPGGQYGTMSGTSQATPFVSGLAALLASQRTAPFDAQQIKSWILLGARNIPLNEDHGLVLSGTVDVLKSLALQSDGSPTQKGNVK